MLEYLVNEAGFDYKANISFYNSDSSLCDTLIHSAAVKGDIEAMNKLMEFGLKVEEFPKDLIQVVAANEKMADAKKLEIIKRLVDLGMPITYVPEKVEIEGLEGWNTHPEEDLVESPLSAAVLNGNVELAKTLLDLGCELEWGCAIRCNVEIVKEVDVSKIHDHLLFSAAAHNDTDVIRELAKKGMDMNMRKEGTRPYILPYMDDESAIWIAAKERRVGTIEALVEGGADINTRSSKTNGTVLHSFLEYSYVKPRKIRV